jgi:predicted DCC family thiol-disulfide oxidoreductase YuxK
MAQLAKLTPRSYIHFASQYEEPGAGELRMTSSRARDRAEALFKKQERQRDGQAAMAEHIAELRATDEKTARLRALRLARDRRALVPRSS